MNRFTPWVPYHPVFRLRLVSNPTFEKLPYDTINEMRSPVYLSIDGVCCIPDLPEHIRKQVCVVLFYHMDKQNEILVKRARAKVKGPDEPPAYMTPAPCGASPIQHVSDEILLCIFKHIDTETLLKSVNR